METRCRLDLEPLLRHATFLQCGLGRQASPLAVHAFAEMDRLFRSRTDFGAKSTSKARSTAESATEALPVPELGVRSSTCPSRSLPLSASSSRHCRFSRCPNATLFPLAKLPLHVFEPRYREMTRYVLDHQRVLAVARLKPGYEASYAARPPVYEICGVGRVVNDQALPDGRYNILLEGVARVRIIEEHPPEQSFRIVRAEALHDRTTDPLLAARPGSKS